MSADFKMDYLSMVYNQVFPKYRFLWSIFSNLLSYLFMLQKEATEIKKKNGFNIKTQR